MTRVALGVVLALFPKSARPWIGRVVDDDDTHGALRVLGVRDALLGVNALRAPDRPDPLLLCAVADAADAAVTAGDFVRTRRMGAAFASVTAMGGAATGLWTWTRTRAGADG